MPAQVSSQQRGNDYLDYGVEPGDGASLIGGYVLVSFITLRLILHNGDGDGYKVILFKGTELTSRESKSCCPPLGAQQHRYLYFCPVFYIFVFV